MKSWVRHCCHVGLDEDEAELTDRGRVQCRESTETVDHGTACCCTRSTALLGSSFLPLRDSSINVCIDISKCLVPDFVTKYATVTAVFQTAKTGTVVESNICRFHNNCVSCLQRFYDSTTTIIITTTTTTTTRPTTTTTTTEYHPPRSPVTFAATKLWTSCK